MKTDKLGNITLYNADCMEVMKSMPDKSVDFILTDIPYLLCPAGGIGDSFTFSNRKGYKRGVESSIAFISNGIDYDAVFTEFVRVMKKVNACIFCSNMQITKILSWWNGGGIRQHCLCGTSRIRYPWGKGITLVIWNTLFTLKKKVLHLINLKAICC